MPEQIVERLLRRASEWDKKTSTGGFGTSTSADVAMLRAAADALSDPSERRVYLTARYDVTDLSTEERGELALEVQAQAEHSDGHKSCEVEIEWDEVEP